MAACTGLFRSHRTVLPHPQQPPVPEGDRKGDRLPCPALQLYLAPFSLLLTRPCPVCHAKRSTLYQILLMTWLDLEAEKRAQAFSRSYVAREFWEAKSSEHSLRGSKKEQGSQETECPGRMEMVSREPLCSRSYCSCECGPRLKPGSFLTMKTSDTETSVS